jgi:acetylornithine deacetylase
MKAAEELLLDLVAIPSVSAQSNQPVVDYAAALLDPNVWQIRSDTYTDPSGIEKSNLLAFTRNTPDSHVELAFVCHSDTVPFDPNWNEAVHPAVLDGHLYGRGSCDVKSFLACALQSLQGLELSALRKPIALIVTADEEIGCVGAKRLAAQEAFHANYTLIGEPTGLRPVSAGKGYALGTVTVRGREAHSAFPSKGRSAIFDAGRAALALEAIANDLRWESDPTFDPPFTTLNVGTIEGGTAKNIVPGECRLLVEWRPIPGQPANRVPELINRELSRLRHSVPGFDATFQVQRADPAFAPSKTRHLAGLLSSLTGTESATISFGSEAAHLSPLSGETVVFGPGDMTTAHRTGENVPLSELQACAAHLKTVIERLCLA